MGKKKSIGHRWFIGLPEKSEDGNCMAKDQDALASVTDAELEAELARRGLTPILSQHDSPRNTLTGNRRNRDAMRSRDAYLQTDDNVRAAAIRETVEYLNRQVTMAANAGLWVELDLNQIPEITRGEDLTLITVQISRRL